MHLLVRNYVDLAYLKAMVQGVQDHSRRKGVHITAYQKVIRRPIGAW